MSVYNAVLATIISMIQQIEPSQQLSIGSLPVDDSLSIAYASGVNETTFLNKNTITNMTMVLNGKNRDQKRISAILGNIHRQLTKLKQYPQERFWQITNIESSNLPCYLDRENNGQWLYGSGLTVTIYIRGD